MSSFLLIILTLSVEITSFLESHLQKKCIWGIFIYGMKHMRAACMIVLHEKER